MSKRVSEVLGDESIDWKQIVGEMRWAISGYICKHTKKRKGFWGGKWGCNRKIWKGNRCEELGPNKKQLRPYLCRRLEVDSDGANRIIAHLRELGYITTYTCGKVLYNVPAQMPQRIVDILQGKRESMELLPSEADVLHRRYALGDVLHRYPISPITGMPTDPISGYPVDPVTGRVDWDKVYGRPTGPGGLPLPPIGPDGKPRY